MTAAYAKINPNMLSWARDRAQLSVSALAQKLHIGEDKLAEWEEGKKLPTFQQALKFSDKTHIPFGYLFLQQPPEEALPLPDLRTISGNQPLRVSAELRDMIRIVLQRQSWYSEYLIEQGELKNPVVARCHMSTPVFDIVDDMRKILGLAKHPERGSWEEYFRDLIRRIEDIGVLVMRQADVGHWTRPLSVSEFRGFAIADSIAPVIFINQADAPSARLFTLCHELAHIWIGKSGISDSKPDAHRQEEILCNAVAAEFLVPEMEFLSLWKESFDGWQENLAMLEAHFRVSQWVIARRAQTLNKISLSTYQRFIDGLRESYQKKESSKTGTGPSYYVTKHSQISDRFSKAVVSNALSGRLLLRDAGSLLGIKPNNIVKYAKELGI